MSNTSTCEVCQCEVHISDHPFCPHEPSHPVAIGDDIPGGIWIEHGLCNDDGSPRKFYTKSEMTREAKKKGLYQGAFLHGSPHGRTWF